MVNVKESRTALCIYADDHEVARCGVPYAALSANIDSGVTVTVRVVRDVTIPADGLPGTTWGDWLVVTPRNTAIWRAWDIAYTSDAEAW